MLIIIAVSTSTANAKSMNTSSITSSTTAPLFSYPSIDSKKMIGPQNFKGDYLLIDFWASWCPPCHAAIPFLKSAYEKYNQKGFEILGVSIDKDETKWIKAVKSKQLNWSNVRADDGGAKVASLFQFASIPHFVLIDKTGEIVAEGFSASELEGLLQKTIK